MLKICSEEKKKFTVLTVYFALYLLFKHQIQSAIFIDAVKNISIKSARRNSSHSSEHHNFLPRLAVKTKTVDKVLPPPSIIVWTRTHTQFYSSLFPTFSTKLNDNMTK